MRCSVRRLLARSLLPLLFLTACGGGGSSSAEGLDGVTVQGSTDSKPKVQLEDGYSVDTTRVDTLVKGDGPKVGAQDTVTVDYVGINGRTGQEFDSSWKNGQPATFSLGPGMISGFNKALTGQTVGSRVVAAMPPEDAYPQGNPQAGIKSTDSLVFVIDIRGAFPSQAEGRSVTPPADFPHLLTDPQGLPGQFHSVKTTAPAPEQVVVQPVIQGTGAPIKAGEDVTMTFLGQIYPAGQTLVNTYTQGPQTLPIGQGQPLPCFDELVGQSLGSRVILICPPDSAFGPQGNPQANIKGTDTLIFAVDLLDAS
jgi:peptidylprolyl isomerase